MALSEKQKQTGGLKSRLQNTDAYKIVVSKYINHTGVMAVGGGQVNWEMIEFTNVCSNDDHNIDLNGW